MFTDKRPFIEAIEKERPKARLERPITGITVPHHLLAADLMARGFWVGAVNSYERILVLSPDHFNKSRRPLATTRRDIDTAFGRLETDREAAGALLADPTLFEESDLFAQEHGVAALLPFVKHFWPEARIVPMVVSYASTRADWDRAAEAIAKLIGPRTLVLQSTDYSHYLTHQVAQKRDQETLNVIAAEDLDGVARLVQPDHMDSKGSQYIMMRLQAGLGSKGSVIANRNSAEYSALGTRTTSYLVMAYSGDRTVGSELRYDDQEIVYFGGDVLIGRFLTQPLADADVARHVVEEVLKITKGAPLVINLEGVVLDDPPLGVNRDLHMMHASLALPILKALNVKAASLANNHSYDLGVNGFKESLAVLRRAGIQTLQHLQVESLGRLGLVAINFIGARDFRGYPVIKQLSELERLCRMQARSPLIAFVHWGEEYTRDARPSEHAAAQAMHACGVNGIVGAHSHKAALRIEAPQGGEYQSTFSIGNLLFDQKGERASSALIELRLFKQGTMATRLVPMPNLFELAVARLGRKAVEAQSQPEPAAAEPPADAPDIRTRRRPCVGMGC